ncbi:methyltransferase domain-containing protein [Streptosporangium sp. NPDC050855]|uniref:class I SAM-dependent methyltransferase n=1 Tax=Streptosporangium sp. NPDC050855 TaxID=3366194 RepID=UPI00379A8416
MNGLDRQLTYWDTAGAEKTFTHPVDPGWTTIMGREARILDYGCGYGRVIAELSRRGFSDVSGVDLSSALIARGHRLHPDLRLAVLESPPHLPYPPTSFDVVLLFAVLTCIPDDDAQRALIAELVRVLAPGGLLYISDMVLQDDERSRDRYAAYARRFGTPYGVFATDDGAVVRHHDIAGLYALLPEFDLMEERRISVVTMNGHPARAVQLLARKR